MMAKCLVSSCTALFVVIHVIGNAHASFESSGASEALGASAAAAGPSLLKSLWDQFGNSFGSVTNQLGSNSNDLGSTGAGREGNYAPGPAAGRDQQGGSWTRSPASRNQDQDLYWTRPPMNQGPNRNNGGGGQRTAPVSTERTGRNRFPDPTRIYDNVERETTVMLRVAPVLSQSTRNTPYEIIESIFHGPWSWEYAAQHVYALHWDLEYRFDPFGDTIFTFGSRKESDGKLWGSLDKKAFTEMPAKYFFLGNITTSPKAATQAAYDNSLNGQPYDVMSVNCQSWAIQHCKDMSEDLYLRMKNFPTLLESTKYAALWAQSVIASSIWGTTARPKPTSPRDSTQLW